MTDDRPSDATEPQHSDLPDLDDITFATPGPPATEQSAPQPDPPAPPPATDQAAQDPRAMSPRAYRTLVAAARALVGRDEVDTAPLEVARAIDTWLGAGPAAMRERFARALRVLEWSTLAGRTVRRFSSLGPATAAAAIARARAGRVRVRREAASLIADVCLNAWAATPAAERRIGFDYGCVADDPPRAEPPLEILSYPQIHRDHTEECDVVVVGSGAAGGVVAARLAEAGLSVVVIEEGGYHPRAAFAGAPAERARRLYREMDAIVARGAPDVRLSQGHGIGGSTLVSYGSMYRTPDEVLARWVAMVGGDQPPGFGLRPSFDEIEAAMNVGAVPEELLGPATPRIREAARAIGAHGGVIRRSIDGCRGCGVCSVGCPSGAKLGTHLVFLPQAQQHGASIYANARARHILVEDGRAAGVVATLVEQSSRAPKATLTVRASTVVLAAGAIHTPHLLLENALGNQAGAVGRHLSVQPSVSVHGWFDDRIEMWRGTQQPFAIDEWLAEKGILLEVTSLVPSADAGSIDGAGPALLDRLERLGHALAIRVTAADDGAGRVARGTDGSPAVTYRISDDTRRRLHRGIAESVELLLRAGAREVTVGPGVAPMTTAAEAADLSLPAGSTAVRSLGPSGSTRMGTDPSVSVVDPAGVVHGVPGLVVADASVLPTTPVVPPQATVMAMAARIADAIITRAGSGSA